MGSEITKVPLRDSLKALIKIFLKQQCISLYAYENNHMLSFVHKQQQKQALAGKKTKEQKRLTKKAPSDFYSWIRLATQEAICIFIACELENVTGSGQGPLEQRSPPPPSVLLGH